MQSRRVFDAAGIAPTLSSGTTEGANIQPSILDVAPTITAQRGRGAQPPNVLSYGFKYHVSACAGTTGFEEECAPTQIAGKPPAVVTNYGPDVSGILTARGDSLPIPMQGRNVVCMTESSGSGGGVRNQGDVAPTLREDRAGTGAMVVCMANWTAKAPVDEGLCGTITASNAKNPPAVAYAVRRLTPRECERLQGFPDGWTKVPYRGRPADECPDGPRYKALGNSMAVPVMEWIGKRILAVETLYGEDL